MEIRYLVNNAMTKQNQLYRVKPIVTSTRINRTLSFIYFNHKEKYVCLFDYREQIYRSMHFHLFATWCGDLKNKDDPIYIYQKISAETLLTHKNPVYREWARKKSNDL